MKLSNFLPQRGLESAANLFAVVQRRIWSKPGKAHIELPDLKGEEYRDFVEILQRELERHEAVFWAVANGAMGRMIVAWDEDRAELEAIMEIVAQVEERFHLSEGVYSSERSDHPGDDEPIMRGLVRMGSSLAGTAAGVVMKVTRRKPGRRRFDLAALTSILDNVPHIREALVQQIGQTSADISIGLVNPLAQGVGSGPISPLLDFGFQMIRYLEAVERRQHWNEREPQLCDGPDRSAAPRERKRERPIPIPNGPIEAYAEDVWNMSLGGFMVGLADTQQLESAITPVLDALPKPARFGRDAFASQLHRIFGRRQMTVLEPEALGRLDRIDCIIVDEDLLNTGRWTLDYIVSSEAVDKVDAYVNAEALIDPDHPELHQKKGDWELSPAADVEHPKKWEDELRSRGARGDFLALRHREEVVALFSLRVINDEASQAFINAIHEANLELIIAADGTQVGGDFNPHRVIKRDGLHRFIRHIQRDHQVVGFFGNGHQPAMREADVSIGFSMRGADIPWNADIIAGDKLDDAIFVINALTKARKVSERCAVLAGSGAAIGALSAIRGLKKTRPGRVMIAVNLASLLALFYGTAQARQLQHQFRTAISSPQPWHRLEISEIFERLQTTKEGLSDNDVQQRKSDTLEPPTRLQRAWKAVRSEMSNPLTPVLTTGAVVSAVVGSMTDAAIVATVIAFNGVVGGAERFRAEEKIDAMERAEALQVRVLRDGLYKEIDAEQLVVGDIITLESGDVVPADCRIIEAEQLEVDESSLTGESLPIAKTSAPSFSHIISQRRSMLYDGTAVIAGTVKAVVVAVGPATETNIGHARWLSPKSAGHGVGVEARLERFSKMTIPVIGISGGVLMGLGIFRRRQLEELIGPAVNLAVGAVPEGLPLLATMAQLAAARRLSGRNVIVHNPRAMEALGRADILCIDKTGTLTYGTLKFDGVYDADSRMRAHENWEDIDRKIFLAALRATPTETTETVLPHATDRAIADGARTLGIDVGEWEPIDQLPFKAELGFHAVVGKESGRGLLVVKGSPEAVIARCTGRRSEGKWVRLNASWREKLLQRAEALAGRGLRTLAVAQRRSRDVGATNGGLKPESIQGLTFHGFITLSDPVRPTAREAVESLQRAGVSLLMLTGDHPETARRIARDVGIKKCQYVPTGDQLEAMDDDELAEVLSNTGVIARMTPAQKVHIVQALQSADRAVAMGGDGGNDAAAIRMADVGIAMGADSSTAARDAADMVVTDARIGTLVDAVIEGRGMWRSVRDAVSILIGGNLGEVGFMVSSGLVNTIPALNARQLLLVNLFTDVAPAMAIALRPPPDVSPDELLHEGPEESLGKPLERDILWRAAITGSAGFGAWMIARHSFQKNRASTVGMLAVVCAQLGQTLTTARPTFPVWAASIGTTAALLAIIETPGVSHLLGCRPLGPVGLTTAFGSAAAATAASAVIPRLPQWKQKIEEYLPEHSEPELSDFLDEYYAAVASGRADS